MAPNISSVGGRPATKEGSAGPEKLYKGIEI